jgi:hypothetical protein
MKYVWFNAFLRKGVFAATALVGATVLRYVHKLDKMNLQWRAVSIETYFFDDNKSISKILDIANLICV